MPRKPTARPPGEHLATLTRMLRQVEAADSSELPPERKAVIKQRLLDLMAEFQKQIGGS